MSDVNPGQDPAARPPGWYPHPTMVDTQAYWDGAAWTGQVAPAAPAKDPNASTLTNLLLVVFAVAIAIGILYAVVQLL